MSLYHLANSRGDAQTAYMRQLDADGAARGAPAPGGTVLVGRGRRAGAPTHELRRRPPARPAPPTAPPTPTPPLPLVPPARGPDPGVPALTGRDGEEPTSALQSHW